MKKKVRKKIQGGKMKSKGRKKMKGIGISFPKGKNERKEKRIQ